MANFAGISWPYKTKDKTLTSSGQFNWENKTCDINSNQLQKTRHNIPTYMNYLEYVIFVIGLGK